MSSLIQLRRGTEAQWNTQILAAGEVGYETDSGNMKVGDGFTQWSSLFYFMQPMITTVVTDLSNVVYMQWGRFDLPAPTTYYTNGPLLLDNAEGASKLIVTKTSSGYIQQIVSTNYFFTRAYIGGAWQAWKQLPTSEITNTPNTLVRRDASGNFAAGMITSNLTGVVTGSLATARTIAITGDVAYSQSFDGSANITGAATLANVATAGTTGSSTAIPVVTINAKGLTTGISTVVVEAPAGTLSGATLASNVTASYLTSFGTAPALGTPTGVLTNCTTSSSPSGSTSPASKGYVDNTSNFIILGICPNNMNAGNEAVSIGGTAAGFFTFKYIDTVSSMNRMSIKTTSAASGTWSMWINAFSDGAWENDNASHNYFCSGITSAYNGSPYFTPYSLSAEVFSQSARYVMFIAFRTA